MKVVIAPLSHHPKFKASVLDFAGEILSKYELITSELNIKAKDFEKSYRNRMPSYIKHSSVAYNPNTMQLLGLFLSSDAAYITDTLKMTPEMKLISNLLDQCFDIYFQVKGYNPALLKPNNLFYQEMIAVSPEVKGYQIGTHIFAHNLQLAKILNFKEAKVDTTSSKSAYLGRKLGYEQFGEIIYKDAIVDNSKVQYWKNLTDPTADRVTIFSYKLDNYDINKLKKNENIEYIF